MTDIKQEIAKKATSSKQEVKITKSMSIADMVKVLEPEIKKALPSVITPERFTRMALSSLNNTPKLAECTQMSFLAALMSAAQLGLEPNTSLGQAYLIPYNNKGKLECQFQLGYKGLIDLVYRNDQVQTIQAQTVYENDYFEYELGLNSKLIHRPALHDRGKVILFYALFKLSNGGYGFEVMSKEDIDNHAQVYSKGFTSSYSPWKTDYESMAKKTVIKKLLKYAPLKTDFLRAMSSDETIKSELAVDMTEVQNDDIIDGECKDTDNISVETTV
jgi:recombination protein RecT